MSRRKENAAKEEAYLRRIAELKQQEQEYRIQEMQRKVQEEEEFRQTRVERLVDAAWERNRQLGWR